MAGDGEVEKGRDQIMGNKIKYCHRECPIMNGLVAIFSRPFLIKILSTDSPKIQSPHQLFKCPECPFTYVLSCPAGSRQVGLTRHLLNHNSMNLSAIKVDRNWWAKEGEVREGVRKLNDCARNLSGFGVINLFLESSVVVVETISNHSTICKRWWWCCAVHRVYWMPMFHLWFVWLPIVFAFYSTPSGQRRRLHRLWASVMLLSSSSTLKRWALLFAQHPANLSWRGN